MSSLDLEAIFVALVMAPATYSRNRFFSLYTDPEMRRVRRRAAMIRGVLRHLQGTHAAERGEILHIRPARSGRVDLAYAVPAIGLRRTITLDPIELSLIRFELARAATQGTSLAADDPDRLRIEGALRRLAPASIPPTAPPV